MSSNPLVCDPSKKAELEAANGVDQLDYIADLIKTYEVRDVRESQVLELHRLAVAGVYPCGASYRDALSVVSISDSQHEIPEAAFVPSLLNDLLDRINDRSSSAIERAAYALWRFNWIHPFRGGNGRTARALTYLILCIDLEAMIPGDNPTVPSIIYARREDYIAGLRAADAGELKGGAPDLNRMSNLVEDAVTRQMAAAIQQLKAADHK